MGRRHDAGHSCAGRYTVGDSSLIGIWSGGYCIKSSLCDSFAGSVESGLPFKHARSTPFTTLNFNHCVSFIETYTLAIKARWKLETTFESFEPVAEIGRVPFVLPSFSG